MSNLGWCIIYEGLGEQVLEPEKYLLMHLIVCAGVLTNYLL